MANCEHEIVVSVPAYDDNSKCENKRQCALELKARASVRSREEAEAV